MDFKIGLLLNVIIILICLGYTQSLADEISIVNETVNTKEESFEFPFRQNLVKNFKQPTLDDFKECESRRNECIIKCTNSVYNCLAECPICPDIIVRQDFLVNGINDTNVQSFNSDTDTNTQNQTTIIKLKSILHNYIELPTDNINATSSNNIHIYQNSSSTVGGKFGFGYNVNGSCCLAIQPKTCQFSWSGPRCHNKRTKTCGNHCTSRLIYVRRRQENILHPPPQPKCMYLPYWPFVTCLQNYRERCDGCYEYLAVEDFDTEDIPNRCKACFSYSQYYQPGLIFPMYYQSPPCFVTGSCGIYGWPMKYGEFEGNNFGNTGLNSEMYIPSMDHSTALEFEDLNEKNDGFEKFKENYLDPNEWELEKHLCKIEKEDGTFSIEDCTNSNKVDDLYFLNERPKKSKRLHVNDEKINKKFLRRYRRMNRSSLRRKRARHHRKRHTKKAPTTDEP